METDGKCAPQGASGRREEGGKIYPRFARKENEELAERVLKLYRAGICRMYGAVLRALRKLEDARKLVKELANGAGEMGEKENFLGIR